MSDWKKELRSQLLGDVLDGSAREGSPSPKAAEHGLRELRELGGYFKSASSENDGADTCCQRIDCKKLLCCCITKPKYYQIRRFTYDTLSRNASKFGRRTNYLPSRIFELYSVALVLANVMFSIWIVQSNTEFISDPAAMVFDSISTFCFTFEYLLRLWACIEYHRKTGRARNKCGTRFKWFFKPLSFFDFLCLVPLYIALVGYVVYGGYEMWVALIRVMIFLRLERQAKALGRLRQVLGSKAEELMAGLFFAVVCILYCAVTIYYLEKAFVDETLHVNQFATFGDAVWWAVATITSVGYGDVVPHSWPGQVFGGFVAFLGVATLAIPSGIIGATFVEVMANQMREHASSSFFFSPTHREDDHDGPIGDEETGDARPTSSAAHSAVPSRRGSALSTATQFRGTFGPIKASQLSRTFGPVTPALSTAMAGVDDGSRRSFASRGSDSSITGRRTTHNSFGFGPSAGRHHQHSHQHHHRRGHHNTHRHRNTARSQALRDHSPLTAQRNESTGSLNEMGPGYWEEKEGADAAAGRHSTQAAIVDSSSHEITTLPGNQMSTCSSETPSSFAPVARVDIVQENQIGRDDAVNGHTENTTDDAASQIAQLREEVRQLTQLILLQQHQHPPNQREQSTT